MDHLRHSENDVPVPCRIEPNSFEIQSKLHLLNCYTRVYAEVSGLSQ